MSNLNQFIKNELAKRRSDYLSSPTYILEHYNTEKQNIEAYNGRQLLEMLQNADDATETATNKKVLIKLANNELIIANNGDPFTEDGFRSILYISVSSKTQQRNKIGHKGLGFRSILSWAEEIIINSAGTKVGFSQKYASDFLTNLLEESQDIAEFLRPRKNVENPIATLRIPKLQNGTDDSVQGFDTIITIRLKKNIIKEVQAQIHSIINKETLIFLNNIVEIEIDSPAQKIIYQKFFKNDDKTEVAVVSNDLSSGAEESKSWNIKRKKGKHKGKNYELAIAWNEQLNDMENVLFSYFKTEARFPFGALVHGTFELTQDRKHLEADTEGHNLFLTIQLANLLVESSLDIASKSGKANYLPLGLLNIDFDKIDQLLIDYNFKSILLEKLKQSEIFPNVNGDYFNYTERPVYYDFPIVDLLNGKDVKNLLPSCNAESVISFLQKHDLLHYYSIQKFASIIHSRIGTSPVRDLARLYYLLLTYKPYIDATNAEFHLDKLPCFLIDSDRKSIGWSANVFIQPDHEKDFKLPKFFNVVFINSELVKCLMEQFSGSDTKFLLEILKPYKVREYAFLEVAETMIFHYNKKKHVVISDVIELHKHLFRLYKKESKERDVLPLPSTNLVSVFCQKQRIKRAVDLYFGAAYSNSLVEKLYNFDKSKLLASREDLQLSNEDLGLVKKYFRWIGVADLPRHYLIELKPLDQDFNIYKEYALHNYDYKKPNDWNEYYRDFSHLQQELTNVPIIRVGYFDELKMILTKSKPETIFEWIKRDNNLRKTLEENNEILSGAEIVLNISGKQYLRHFKTSNIRSYSRWLFSTISWMPVEGENKKAPPDKCCMSKTITSEFSPFVEKPNINIASISDKIDLPESTIESYLALVGVHREISSFSVASLYEVLLSLPVADKNGRAAKRIYREIISNFFESRIDINHPSYLSFITTGKIFCRKGNELGYFPAHTSYYIPTKAYGNNILKLFPLAEIDSKQGPHKIEKLFGVKRLKDITFNIIGQPIINILNNEFQNEIERFKALVYVLRKDKDTKHEIASKLKKLHISIAQELQAIFIHNDHSENFDLEHYEYIHHRRKFYISVPTDVLSLTQLRESNKFCQSIAEIFSTIVETEEFSDFIHDLYSKPEFSREPRLLNFTQKDDNTDIVEAKKQLNIIDDVRLSFWRAFSLGCESKLKSEIKNQDNLAIFFSKKLKFSREQSEYFLSQDLYHQLHEFSILELLYSLFIKYNIDFRVFSRHFSGIDFADLFKYKIEEYKLKYRNEFAYKLRQQLLTEPIAKKEEYFQLIDEYNFIKYEKDHGFIKNTESHFINKISSEFSICLEDYKCNYSIEQAMKQTLDKLSEMGITIPLLLKENKALQALLLFGETADVIRRIEIFKTQHQTAPSNPNAKQIKVAGKIICFDDYEALAQEVLVGLNIGNLKLKPGKTVSVGDEGDREKGKPKKRNSRNVRFDTKSEEQIGFIAELICYHKLVENYKEENVRWVSENASRAYPDKFMTGEAGSNYDLELYENGNWRFVEVKGTSSTTNGIYMSKEEIRKAMEFPEWYDLIIVQNPLNEMPALRHIRSPFKFKRGETLLSNSKLKVFNDNFVIKFRWDD